MRIGTNDYKYGIFLAPMAGIADHAFRSLCVSYGAEGVCSELISAKAVVHGDRKTESLARIYDDERPAAIQIFGREPEIMARAARELCAYKPSYIDINMGCPVPKLVRNGEGSALMREPELCERIVYAVASEVNVPVTVKLRAGFDDCRQNAPEVARCCERGGAQAIFVHGRTRSQMYSGKADYSVIARVKESVSVPVVGNGDVCDYQSFEKIKGETGCDGVMIGRGAYGAFWVFRQIICGINGTAFNAPEADEKKAMLLHQLEIVTEDKGENGIREMRHHLLRFCKGFSGSAKMRDEITQITTSEQAIDVIERCVK